MLTVTQMLRQKKVVGKFVEFYGTGLTGLPLADRATIANMAPEYGATMGFFPVDAETLKYLRLTGRPEQHVEAGRRVYQGSRDSTGRTTRPTPFSPTHCELDLGTVEPSLAGPKRPQDRVPLKDAKRMYNDALKVDLEKMGTLAGVAEVRKASAASKEPEKTAAVMVLETEGNAVHTTDGVHCEHGGHTFRLNHGHVVIAAITSCTNTSNPSVMIGAGLLARKARAKGLKAKPWVKTSLAPGSKVVTDYLRAADLQKDLDALGFNLVGYGCTTCIGNSGPLPDPIAKAIEEGKLIVASVLSGNRNFEGRVNPLTRFNYLASPPLVVAYALAGRMDLDLTREPLGIGKDGPVFLRDIWPTPAEVQDEITRSVKAEFFRTQYADVFKGDEQWQSLDVPAGRDVRLGSRVDVREEPSVLRGNDDVAAGRAANLRRAVSGAPR